MKAPDKVYVAAQWHPREKKVGLYASFEKTSHPHEEEFVRKGAILEWAERCINRADNFAYYKLIEELERL